MIGVREETHAWWGTRELWGQVVSSCLVWVVLANGCVTW